MGVIAVQASVGSTSSTTNPERGEARARGDLRRQPLDAGRDPPHARRAARDRRRRRRLACVRTGARLSETSTAWSASSTAPVSRSTVVLRRRPGGAATRRRPHRVPHRAGGADQRDEARRPGARDRGRALRAGRARPRDRRRRPRGQRPRRGPRRARAASACASGSRCTAGRSRPGRSPAAGSGSPRGSPTRRRSDDPRRRSPTTRRWCAAASSCCSAPPTTSRWSARRPTASRRSTWSSGSAPTSCSWTSACPRWTASRRPAGSSAIRRPRRPRCSSSRRSTSTSTCSRRCAPGASGFLLKDTLPVDLLAAIRVVAGGDALLAPKVTRRLIEQFTSAAADARCRGRCAAPKSHPGIADLTEREREVLLAVASGMSNAEIAETMFISHATAKTHVSRLLTKLMRPRPRPARDDRLRVRRRHARRRGLSPARFAGTRSGTRQRARRSRTTVRVQSSNRSRSGSVAKRAVRRAKNSSVRSSTFLPRLPGPNRFVRRLDSVKPRTNAA